MSDTEIIRMEIAAQITAAVVSCYNVAGVRIGANSAKDIVGQALMITDELIKQLNP